MMGEVQPFLVRDGGAGRFLLCAPAPGRVIVLHPVPSLVGPGVRLALLERLGRRVVLVVPRGAAGEIEDPLGDGAVRAVGYGDPVFVLLPAAARPEGADAPAAGHEAESFQGGWVLRAPSDGIFYLRPSPAEPPFVEPGNVVRKGQPIGLIEVMKTFSQIPYEGPDFPDEARVEAVLAADGAEVQAGQPLVRLAPCP